MSSTRDLIWERDMIVLGLRRGRADRLPGWSKPLPPHPEDAERWMAFCRTVNHRIEMVRYQDRMAEVEWAS